MDRGRRDGTGQNEAPLKVRSLVFVGALLAACGTSEAGSNGEPAPVPGVDPDASASGEGEDGGTPPMMMPPSMGAPPVAGTGGSGGTAASPVPEPTGCRLDSGFPGDDLCIAPPEPGEGIQIHVGPEDYDDPAQVNRFLLAAGQETHEHYFLKSANTEDVHYFPRNYRMRPGSHHMVIHRVADDHPDGWAPASSADLLFRVATLEGAQNTVYDVPKGGVMPPENAGLGMELPARSQLRVNLHHFNPSGEPMLREIWVNVWFKDPDAVRETTRNVFMLGGLLETIAPGTTRKLDYQCLLPHGGGRLLTLLGHRHAHTTRFSAWLVRAGERTLVYEDYDPSNPTTLFYDSLTDNPAPDAGQGVAGGESGVLEFQTGDWLQWECEVENDSNAALRFSNLVNEGEMCILFGTSTGATDANCTHP